MFLGFLNIWAVGWFYAIDLHSIQNPTMLGPLPLVHLLGSKLPF